MSDLDEAIRLAPDNGDAFLERGKMKRGFGLLDEARSDVEKARKLFVAQGDRDGQELIAAWMEEKKSAFELENIPTDKPH